MENDTSLNSLPTPIEFFKTFLLWWLPLDSGYPKSLSDGFEGIPHSVDAALVWAANSKIYFFKGQTLNGLKLFVTLLALSRRQVLEVWPGQISRSGLFLPEAHLQLGGDPQQPGRGHHLHQRQDVFLQGRQVLQVRRPEAGGGQECGVSLPQGLGQMVVWMSVKTVAAEEARTHVKIHSGLGRREKRKFLIRC